MKAKLLTIVLLMSSVSIKALAGDKTALMIVTHGSPSEHWNALSHDVCNEVRKLADQKGINTFNEIKLAFLEFVEPSVFMVVEDFEKSNITEAYVVPLFIAPSGHSIFDLPAALGIYCNSEIMTTLEQEGTKILNTKIKFVVGPTLYPGNIIQQIALDRVREVSTNPKKEALIVMAHGDDNYGRYWKDLVQDMGGYICGQLGIERHRGAFIHIGQNFPANGLTEIQRALEKKESVIVANLFLSLDIKAVESSSVVNFMGQQLTCDLILKGKDVRYCRGLLPDKRVAEWVLDTALEISKK